MPSGPDRIRIASPTPCSEVGRHTDVRPPQWMRYYRVFWLPRPWPLWLATIPKPERPVNLEVAYVTVLVMAVSGTLALRAGRGPANLRPVQSAKA